MEEVGFTSASVDKLKQRDVLVGLTAPANFHDWVSSQKLQLCARVTSRIVVWLTLKVCCYKLVSVKI